MDPRSAIRALEQPVRFLVADDSLMRRIPIKSPVQLHRDIRQNAARSRNIRLLDVRDGFGARVDRGEKIFHVRANRRSDVLFEILLGLVT